MPNKYAVIIFICSLAFAATTVFLLCLLQPKTHQKTQSDAGKGSLKYGLDAYEALAGLPIKKRETTRTRIQQPGYEFEKRIEPFYEEWAEMGLSVRSIRPIENLDGENGSIWNKYINSRKTELPKQIIPMARVMYWQDQLDACEAYKSILCHKAISYWMTMNGLNVANIVNHGRRQTNIEGGDIAGESVCKTANVKDPNCTREAPSSQNEGGIDQFSEFQILNASKAGSEIENADARINVAEAEDRAQKANLKPGFIIDTKYPSTPDK